MEWVIPLQKLEVGKIQTGTFMNGAKPLAPLYYMDGETHFPSLSILLPALTVKIYEPNTGRLVLSLRDSAGSTNKLQALQASLLSYVYSNQLAWFNQGRRDLADLQQLFQPMVDGDMLHLYCPVSVQDKKSGGVDSIVVYRSENGGHVVGSHGVRPTFMQPGDSVRVCLRIQGISFHNHPIHGEWTGRFRLQHKIIALYINSKRGV
jgi:hypothetical protein